MQKSVFRPNETKANEDKVLIPLAHKFTVEEQQIQEEEIPEYTGPTADDLRREAEVFKKQWEVEKQQMVNDATQEAQKMVENAEKTAFQEVKRNTDRAAIIKKQAEEDAERILKEAEEKSLNLIQQAEEKHEEKLQDAYEKGFRKGSKDGYEDGVAEANRLVGRMHTILEKTMDTRIDILNSTEQQIIELVLLMTRKVVKVLSESQRSVLMSNVVQALRKVKGRGDVTIRVNLADLKLTTEHTKEFIQAVENIQKITVIEDSTVQRGGCIVDTDFGAIDARISSQLAELEKKILELTPIKTINTQTAVAMD
ncbi:MAG TPA: flagellar assembly protein FliH [Treponemataceae bacterium]|nr:flagellar assembly protein FliH [Treponemataceae bacterium]